MDPLYKLENKPFLKRKSCLNILICFANVVESSTFYFFVGINAKGCLFGSFQTGSVISFYQNYQLHWNYFSKCNEYNMQCKNLHTEHYSIRSIFIVEGSLADIFFKSLDLFINSICRNCIQYI